MDYFNTFNNVLSMTLCCHYEMLLDEKAAGQLSKEKRKSFRFGTT